MFSDTDYVQCSITSTQLVNLLNSNVLSPESSFWVVAPASGSSPLPPPPVTLVVFVDAVESCTDVTWVAPTGGAVAGGACVSLVVGCVVADRSAVVIDYWVKSRNLMCTLVYCRYSILAQYLT